jgi:hypothetical protein
MFLLMANQNVATRFRREQIRLAGLEENGRSATVERGNLARAEKGLGVDRLLEDQFKWEDGCGTTGHRVSQLLETDAFAAQFGMGELFLRRRRLARVANAVRKRGVLCRKQQQRQQTEKDASQFHVVLNGTVPSVARWPEFIRTPVMIRRQQTDWGNQFPVQCA